MTNPIIVWCPSGRHSVESDRATCKNQQRVWRDYGCSACKAEKEKPS